uniref:Uncharacterized protein n=1 Tax=Litopenaeus vannamei majanivirus Nimav-1_LVa TaxID=2984273 RepID=A0A9C7BH57_9VIRU|nr:MAG: hypothetical protein [Litopenaeus vannamei majanivirus Nimav-1_LVa]
MTSHYTIRQYVYIKSWEGCIYFKCKNVVTVEKDRQDRVGVYWLVISRITRKEYIMSFYLHICLLLYWQYCLVVPIDCKTRAANLTTGAASEIDLLPFIFRILAPYHLYFNPNITDEHVTSTVVDDNTFIPDSITTTATVNDDDIYEHTTSPVAITNITIATTVTDENISVTDAADIDNDNQYDKDTSSTTFYEYIKSSVNTTVNITDEHVTSTLADDNTFVPDAITATVNDDDVYEHTTSPVAITNITIATTVTDENISVTDAADIDNDNQYDKDTSSTTFYEYIKSSVNTTVNIIDEHVTSTLADDNTFVPDAITTTVNDDDVYEHTTSPVAITTITDDNISVTDAADIDNDNQYDKDTSSTTFYEYIKSSVNTTVNITDEHVTSSVVDDNTFVPDAITTTATVNDDDVYEHTTSPVAITTITDDNIPVTDAADIDNDNQYDKDTSSTTFYEYIKSSVNTTVNITDEHVTSTLADDNTFVPDAITTTATVNDDDVYEHTTSPVVITTITDDNISVTDAADIDNDNQYDKDTSSTTFYEYIKSSVNTTVNITDEHVTSTLADDNTFVPDAITTTATVNDDDVYEHTTSSISVSISISSLLLSFLVLYVYILLYYIFSVFE